MSDHPTSYPDINEILNLLLINAQRILQDKFVGMYLYGSLSSGDFNPETSDIDFLVVTTEILSEDRIAELNSMHQNIWKSGMKWAAKLEGSYVHKDLIRKHNPNGAPCPTINEGNFYVGGLGSDWIIQRHVVREFGVIVEGPDPKTLIDPVSPEDIRTAVFETLNEWWFPMLDDPTWLRAHRSNYHGFAVITMCRAMHAIENGTIVSKPVAVEWAKETLDPRWRALLTQAVESQYGRHSNFLNETLEFIRYTQARMPIKRLYNKNRITLNDFFDFKPHDWMMYDMSETQFRFITHTELNSHREAAIQLARDSWPEFMWHDAVAEERWHEFFDRFAKYQSVLLDTTTNQVAALGHSLPFRWDKSLAELPEEGWDWVIQQAIKGDKNGAEPNLLAAVFVGVREEYKKSGLSRTILLSFQPTARTHGFKNLVIPVRPNEKPKYPLTTMDDYVTWKNDAGLPFDLWLRIQHRAGGRVIKICHKSKTVRGSRAEWEKWTGIKFPQSGQYITPGALNPIEMNVERDEGVYIEPNVWMQHSSA